MLTVDPLNISAHVGASVTMSCQTSLSAAVDWRRKLLSADRFEIFCYHGSITEGYEDKFSISNPDNGVYVVTVRNIQLNDSGEYRCIEGVDTDPNYGTILLRVIGNHFIFCLVLSNKSFLFVFHTTDASIVHHHHHLYTIYPSVTLSLQAQNMSFPKSFP